MDARRSPPVLRHHASNQLAQILVGAGPSRFTAEVTPVGALAAPVPGDDGCGLHDRQGGRTSRSRPAGVRSRKVGSTATNFGCRPLRTATASCCRRARFSKTKARRENVRDRTDQSINLRTRSIAGACTACPTMASYSPTKFRIPYLKRRERNCGEPQRSTGDAFFRSLVYNLSLAVGSAFLQLAPLRNSNACVPRSGCGRPSGLSLEEAQRRHILLTLSQCDWVIEGPRGAAKRLGLNANTLRSRMEKLVIRRNP